MPTLASSTHIVLGDVVGTIQQEKKNKQKASKLEKKK